MWVASHPPKYGLIPLPERVGPYSFVAMQYRRRLGRGSQDRFGGRENLQSTGEIPYHFERKGGDQSKKDGGGHSAPSQREAAGMPMQYEKLWSRQMGAGRDHSRRASRRRLARSTMQTIGHGERMGKLSFINLNDPVTANAVVYRNRDENLARAWVRASCARRYVPAVLLAAMGRGFICLPASFVSFWPVDCP